MSCIFRLYENKDASEKGSLGVGFTINKGVIVKAKKSNRTIVKINGKEKRFETVRYVIDKLTSENIEINITSQVPFGCGFGLSGGSAIAAAYAINKLLTLRKSKLELAKIAHIAEVVNSTGRGDVGGQYNGGFMIKTERKPLVVKRYRIKKNVYYKVFGEIETKTVIDSKKKVLKINKAGDAALKRVKELKRIDFPKIIEISKEFALDSGLLKSKRMIRLIDKIEAKGGKASMIMLGEAVFSDIPFKGCEKAEISYLGARLL